MNLAQSVLSTEIISVQVTFTVNNTTVDPRGDTVQFAFKAAGVEPLTGDWTGGDWDTAGPPYLAQMLVGPVGTVTLTTGAWEVWVKVTDNPEVPVRRVATLTIF